MVNIIDGQQCKTHVRYKEKYKDYCNLCFYKIFPLEVPNYNKIKEKTVVDFIKFIYDNEKIRNKLNFKKIRFELLDIICP